MISTWKSSERWKSAEERRQLSDEVESRRSVRQIELEITPAFPEQELITNRSTRVTYWEGAAQIRAKVRGQPVNGNGYVEMTGYAGKLTI